MRGERRVIAAYPHVNWRRLDVGEAANSKHIWVDYLRVIATFSVVLLHSAAPLLDKFKEIPEAYWMTGNVYDSLVRMCVPSFFMISGYLLLGKREPLALFFSKRLNKVLLPLIAWSLIYIVWGTYYEEGGKISLYSLYSILLTPAYRHLWFLYAIIGIYLFLPILRVFIEKSDKDLIYYYLALWFVAVAIIPIGENVSRINSKIDLLSISGYSGYFVLGFLLGNTEITRKIAISAFFIFVVSSVITITGTYFLTVRHDGNLSGYFYGYLTPNVIFQSAATLILVKYSVNEIGVFSSDKMLSFLKSLSSASFGIYLIHMMFLTLLTEGNFGFAISGFEWHPAISVPATALATFMLSYVSIFFLRKIPFLNKISP